MSANQNPNINPANLKSLSGVFSEVLKSFLAGVNDMLPAQVISYDRAINRAQVQPLIMFQQTDGTTIARAPIASVPVAQMGGGGFMLNFPLNAGDLGWIKANDRDISLFLTTYAQAAPNTDRMHNFSDCVFFPNAMTGFTVASGNAASCVLQNLSGTVCIALSGDQVTIKAPNVIIDCPQASTTGNFVVGTAASGSFTTPTGQMVTVQNGIIINIF